MKFLIIGDLHGKMPRIHFKEFDAIIAPGDFCLDHAKEYMWMSYRSQMEGKPRAWWDFCGGKEKAKQ